jgi:hypothetical protein
LKYAEAAIEVQDDEGVEERANVLHRIAKEGRERAKRGAAGGASASAKATQPTAGPSAKASADAQVRHARSLPVRVCACCDDSRSCLSQAVQATELA